MYDKVTPNFPMAQVLGRPKTKSLCKDLLLASKSDEWVLPSSDFRVLIPETVSLKCSAISTNLRLLTFATVPLRLSYDTFFVLSHSGITSHMFVWVV